MFPSLQLGLQVEASFSPTDSSSETIRYCPPRRQVSSLTHPGITFKHTQIRPLHIFVLKLRGIKTYLLYNPPDNAQFIKSSAFLLNSAWKWQAMKRENVHCIIYLMMVFLETTYKAKYFRFQGDWQTASLALQGLSKTDSRNSIKGLHFTPHCDLANILLLQTVSVSDTHEPSPHLKALEFLSCSQSCM